MLLMLLSNLKCEIKTEIEKRKGANVNKGRLMLLWKFAVCDSIKLIFIKKKRSKCIIKKLQIKNTTK